MKNIMPTGSQTKKLSGLLTEAASLDKIINAVNKDNSISPFDIQRLKYLLINGDPTAVTNARGRFVGKYWKWIYNQFKQDNVNMGGVPELHTALNTYNINKSQINRPIDSFNSLDELVGVIAEYNDSFKATRTLSKGEQELEKVYEDQYVTVYVPHTWEAARKIGGDTHWCTASSSDRYFNMYLNNYGGEYYDIIRKSDGAKFQLHVESEQFMDSDDRSVNFLSVFDTKKEAIGLINFLIGKGKNIYPWFPNTWPDEVEEKLNSGEVLADIFDKIYTNKGTTYVYLNNKANILDANKRKLLCDRWFDDIFHQFCGVHRVRLHGKQNYINLNGKLISDMWFDDTYGFYDGVGIVNIGNKFNYIDLQGNLLSDEWFDYVYSFKEGFGEVELNGKFNYINKKGEFLSNEWFDYASRFEAAIARVVLNGARYYINKKGTLIKKTNENKMKRRTVVISEQVADNVIDDMISEAFRPRYAINSNAVLQVVRYLDSHFTRDTITDITSDDKIVDKLVGNRIDTHGQVVDQPELKKIVKMLEDVSELKSLISDKKVREKFFAIVVYAWHRRWIDMQTGIIYGLNDFEV